MNNLVPSCLPQAYFQIHSEQGWAVVDGEIVQRPAHRSDETGEQIAAVVAQYEAWLVDNPR